MKMIKKELESKQEINTKTYLKNKKTKRETMEKTNIAICLKKKKQTKRISKKLSRG